jgi:diguanylate cyclase (GGDEF)-like protein/putative nucleotidyltransferase with HDIG domain
MPTKAKVFQSAILVLGLTLLVKQSLEWGAATNPLFLSYLLLSIACAYFKLGIPTTTGNMPVGFIFILTALAQLTVTQALIIGVTGTLVAYLRETNGEIDVLAISFHTAVTIIGVEAANAAYRGILTMFPQGGMEAGLPMAAIMLFLVTAFPEAATTSLNERLFLRRVWYNRFLWSLPYYLSGAAVAALLTTVVYVPWWRTALVILPLMFLVYKAYTVQLDATSKERKHADELATLQLGMVESLALAVESKDFNAVGQLNRMAVYAVGLGRAIGLSEEQVFALRAAAILHDIGQVAVPDHIIMKPGRLTPEEFDRLKVHPDVGADIVERARFPYEVGPIIRAHHERWDGSGYPRRLKGYQIPIEARVLAVIDTLVALTSERHHRVALPLEEAMAVVRGQAGTSLDPEIVAVMERIYLRLEQEARTSRPLAASASHHLKESDRDNNPLAAPNFLATIAAARLEEQSLLEFTQILGNSLNLQETLTALARRFQRVVPFETMVLYLVKEGRIEASLIEGENYTLYKGLSMALGEGVSGMAALNRRPALNADPAAEPLFTRARAKMKYPRSALAVPLESAKGLVGVLTFYSVEQEGFALSHLSLLMAIAPRLATSVENSMRFLEAESQATYDFLTGLPNASTLYVHLQTELARAARTEDGLAVLVCDLDGFKLVNDRFGHLAGNKLLQAVGAGLKEHCREYDFVARLGGDEFVLVLPGATAEAAQQRRRRLSEMVVNAGIKVCGERVVDLSMGMALYPKEGKNAEDLLTLADTRMYDDKALRKSMRAQVAADTAFSSTWFPGS